MTLVLINLENAAAAWAQVGSTYSPCRANVTARKNSIHSTLKKKISEAEIQLEDKQEKARKEPDRVKTSDIEDYREYKQVDNEGKKLFDFITSSVWNSRKDMVDLLRPHWNQNNEIVDLFYAITECHGWIRSNTEEVRVRLEPLEQPRRRFAQEQLCRKLTYLATRLPMGKLLVMEVENYCVPERILDSKLFPCSLK